MRWLKRCSLLPWVERKLRSRREGQTVVSEGETEGGWSKRIDSVDGEGDGDGCAVSDVVVAGVSCVETVSGRHDVLSWA